VRRRPNTIMDMGPQHRPTIQQRHTTSNLQQLQQHTQQQKLITKVSVT